MGAKDKQVSQLISIARAYLLTVHVFSYIGEHTLTFLFKRLVIDNFRLKLRVFSDILLSLWSPKVVGHVSRLGCLL